MLYEGSQQHRDSVGMNVTSKDKVTVSIEGLRLERVARVIVAWVQHTIVVYVALVVEGRACQSGKVRKVHDQQDVSIGSSIRRGHNGRRWSDGRRR